MKQKLDEVRTLAIKLFEAGEAEKRKQPKHIWEGQTRQIFYEDKACLPAPTSGE